ncbi:UDP-glycosyltransferase 13 [Vanrija pseudolonga]|uniref:UDP-glycosyltransferase 13 n=1 Tax=Vanrija pseudolonga TaxID=143232 RepID=A0AAF0YHL7_9TREE|nr:UDP-glycosyltransferase 13 [Vanrija pseudolonga]
MLAVATPPHPPALAAPSPSNLDPATPTPTHIAFVTWPAVGHVTPMMDFALALLDAQPHTILSFLTSPDMVAFLDRAGHTRSEFGSRLRIIPTGSEALGDNPLDDEPMKLTEAAKGVDKNTSLLKTMRAATQIAVHFREVFPLLLADKPVADVPSAGAPVTSVVCNWMTFGIDQLVKAIAPSTKLFSFFDHSCFFSTRILGPRADGGLGGVAGLWAEYCTATGHVPDDKAELERQFGRRFGDDVYYIPGSDIVPIKDCEMSPQAPAYLLDIPITPSLLNIQGLVERSDAMLINTYGCVERHTLDFLEPSIKTPIVPIGPVMLGRVGAKEGGSAVTSFLDAQPAASTLYVSFGTLFRPNPEQLADMIETLLEEYDIPFVWTLGGQKSLTAELHSIDVGRVEAINRKLDAAVAAGKAHICNWVDQHAVLNHPNVGFFLSHGGWNSATETLLAGKPMILFPFFGDQLFTARVLEARGVATVINSSIDQPIVDFHASVTAALSLCKSDGADRLRQRARQLQLEVLAERSAAAKEGVWGRIAEILE